MSEPLSAGDVTKLRSLSLQNWTSYRNSARGPPRSPNTPSLVGRSTSETIAWIAREEERTRALECRPRTRTPNARREPQPRKPASRFGCEDRPARREARSRCSHLRERKETHLQSARRTTSEPLDSAREREGGDFPRARPRTSRPVTGNPGNGSISLDAGASERRSSGTLQRQRDEPRCGRSVPLSRPAVESPPTVARRVVGRALEQDSRGRRTHTPSVAIEEQLPWRARAMLFIGNNIEVGSTKNSDNGFAVTTGVVKTMKDKKKAATTGTNGAAEDYKGRSTSKKRVFEDTTKTRTTTPTIATTTKAAKKTCCQVCSVSPTPSPKKFQIRDEGDLREELAPATSSAKQGALAPESDIESLTPVEYPIANRGDYTVASAKPLFFQVLFKSFAALRKRLKREVPIQSLDKWADFMARCYLQDTRMFHSFGHVMKLCEKSTPVQKIAVLFHDIAYYQVDNAPPPDSKQFLGDILTHHQAEAKEHIYVVTGNGSENAGVAIALKVFSIKMGQKLDPTIGLNEFASAVIASRLLLEEDVIPLDLIADVCAVIEATIPFRTNQWTEGLHTNLLELNRDLDMGRREEDITSSVEEAVDLGNRDVGDFGESEVLLFLDGTWDLLTENNPRIWMELEQCPIQVYRSGLQKTHGFLSTVATELVFSKFREIPTQKRFDYLSRNAKRNVEVSRVYSGIKLSLALIVESLEMVRHRRGEVNVMTIDVRKEVGCLSKGLQCDLCTCYSPTKRTRTDRATCASTEASPCDILRVLGLHRPIKYSRIDEALTYLGLHLIQVLQGDLGALETLMTRLKGQARLYAPYADLSHEAAQAILDHAPKSVVNECARVFSL